MDKRIEKKLQGILIELDDIRIEVSNRNKPTTAETMAKDAIEMVENLLLEIENESN